MLRKEKNRIKKLFQIVEQGSSYRAITQEDIALLTKQCNEYSERIEEIRTDIEENGPQGYVGQALFYQWRPAHQAWSQKERQLESVQLLIERIVNGI